MRQEIIHKKRKDKIRKIYKSLKNGSHKIYDIYNFIMGKTQEDKINLNWKDL